jgi:4'-phosphopantetheinyl transferase
VKATGEGLARPLDSFEIDISPGGPPRLVTVDGDAGRARLWTLRDLCPQTGYAGALVIRGPIERLWQWQWDWPRSW